MTVDDKTGKSSAEVGEMEGPSSRDQGAMAPYACPTGARRSYGPSSPPDDLLQFVRENALGDVIRALGFSNGTVDRLRKGYWPNDPRKILQSWSRFKARRGIVASAWFLRRVRVGGVVRHAGVDYSAPRLEARTGQMLALARGSDGELIAQALEQPPIRMVLARVAGEVRP